MRLMLSKRFVSCAVLVTLLGVCGLAFGAQAQELSAGEREDRYLRLTQVNPLYAWPGVNLDHMERAIAALRSSRSEILSVAGQYGVAQRERIEAVLYPTAYLSEMGTLEVQRRALADGADKDRLHAYHTQLLRTIEAHQTYLTVLNGALETTARELSYKGLEYHFGRSSFEHFRAGIAAYRADAARSHRQARARWACLEADRTECERPAWLSVPEPEVTDVSMDVFQSAPARITRAIRAQGRLGGEAIGPGWALLTQSDCAAKPAPVPFLLWQIPTASGVPIFRPEVVSDVLVHDHQIDQDSNAYERILDSLGMERFLFQPHTNLYSCPDAAGDAARLRAIAYVFETAKTFDWQSAGSTPELDAALERLGAASQRLRTAPVLIETQAQHVVHEISLVLAGFERGDLVAALGELRLRQLETCILSYQLRTPYFAQDIMNLIYGNTAIGDYVPHAPWGFLEELLFTRNGPELLLGGTNRSIIRENYPQIENHRDGVSPRLLSFARDLSSAFEEGDVVEILLGGLAAEYRLAQFLRRPYLFER